MTAIDLPGGVRGMQAFVEMRDGAKMNTLVYLPSGQGPFPVILARTPYGITKPQGQHATDPAHGWLPDAAEPLRGSILRGWQEIRGSPSTWNAMTAEVLRIRTISWLRRSFKARSSLFAKGAGR